MWPFKQKKLTSQAESAKGEISKEKMIALFTQASISFEEGDYESCVKALKAGGIVVNPLLGIQLTINGLMRLGRKEEAREAGARGLQVQNLQHDPWGAELIELTLGERSIDEVLASASDETQECQVHYYAGLRYETLGQADKAYSTFNVCGRKDLPNCVEWLWARTGFCKLHVKQLMREAAAKYRQQDYAGSLEDAREALAVAENWQGQEGAEYRAAQQLIERIEAAQRGA